MGHTTKVFLGQGEPILASKLSSIGGGLSVRIPESMRASSVNVNEVSGVSGFILPGDRVDVIVTIDRAGDMRNSVAKTILQGHRGAGRRGQDREQERQAARGAIRDAARQAEGR
jgi:pilus assembly protein CpaB